MSKPEEKWFEDMYPRLIQLRFWDSLYREAISAIAAIYEEDAQGRDVGLWNPFPQKQWPIRLDTPSLVKFSIVVCRDPETWIEFDLSGLGIGSKIVNPTPGIDGKRHAWVRSMGMSFCTDDVELVRKAQKEIRDALQILLPLRAKD